MRKIYTLILLAISCVALSSSSSAQVVVNKYAAVSSVSNGKSNATVVVDNGASFSVGDRVIIMQMKGAATKTTDDASFGTITAYNGTGNYEFAEVGEISNNTVILTCRLQNSYTPATGKVQLVKVFVPVLDANGNYDIKDLLTAQAWNGKTGGVVAIETEGDLTLLNNIDVSEKGFRGGRVSTMFKNNLFGQTSYRYTYSTNVYENGNQGGEKGEGIAEYPTSMSAGRGAIANGGGGGNAHNCGGGGGGNGGIGGHGGHEAGAANNVHGGLEGYKLDYQGSAVYMGGGGGGAHINNGGGSKGGIGGGIVIIMANNIIPSSKYSITANGETTASYVGYAEADGQGGAGAGGAVVLELKNPTAVGGQKLQVEAKGGKGGDVQWLYQTGTYASPGGGGGGGVIIHNSLASTYLSATVAGGPGGIAKDIDGTASSYGATSGATGLIKSSVTIPESCSPAGIDEEAAGVMVNIYPNPASNVLNIRIAKGSAQSHILLTDLTGRRIPVEVTGTVGNYSIDISGIKPGVYQVEVFQTTGFVSKLKVIKQ